MTYMHRRIIQLTHFGDMPKFDTQKEVNEFHKMIGRLACYMEPAQAHDTVQYVHIFVRDKGEVTAAYYKAEKAHNTTPDGYTDGDAVQPARELAPFVERIINRAGTPFVLGAIFSDGKWGFHS